WKNITKLLAAESLLLVGAGATVGALLAGMLLPRFREIAQTRVPRIDEIRFDAPVFFYTLAAAALTALVIVVPSVAQASRREVAASTNMAPLTLGRTETSRWATRFGIKGAQYPDGAFPVAQIRFVTDDYFATLKIPVLRGRALTHADRNKPLWVINDALARQY